MTYLGFYLLMFLGYINQLFFTPKVAMERNRDVSIDGCQLVSLLNCNVKICRSIRSNKFESDRWGWSTVFVFTAWGSVLLLHYCYGKHSCHIVNILCGLLQNVKLFHFDFSSNSVMCKVFSTRGKYCF
jgi:hypothetical protein